MRVKYPDLEAKLLDNNAYWLNEVGVIGNNDCKFILPLMTIIQKVSCKVNVRTFLFSFINLHLFDGSNRCYKGHQNFRLEKMTIGDVNLRKSAQRSQIQLLANGLIWIMRSRRNFGGKIPNQLNIIVR